MDFDLKSAFSSSGSKLITDFLKCLKFLQTTLFEENIQLVDFEKLTQKCFEKKK